MGITQWVKRYAILINTVIATSALMVSAVSIYSSFSAIAASHNAAKANLYFEFKQRFQALQDLEAKVAGNRHDTGYIASPKHDPKGWAYFEKYWQLSFDEWYASTQLFEPEAHDLWKRYYGPSIRDALDKPYYLQSLCYLFNKSSPTFRAQKDQFRFAILRLYRPGVPPKCLSVYK